jgi:hypothetical protein
MGVHSTTSFTHTNGPPLGLKAEKGGVQMVYAEEERRSNYVPRKNYEKKGLKRETLWAVYSQK